LSVDISFQFVLFGVDEWGWEVMGRGREGELLLLTDFLSSIIVINGNYFVKSYIFLADSLNSLKDGQP